MNFSYWEKADPTIFLADDRENPSRAWAAGKIGEMVSKGALSVVEVGPGSGLDYATYFKAMVADDKVVYQGWEGSSHFCEYLREMFPEVPWTNRPLLDLPQRAFDVVYARHVLEHQPTLEPSLSRLLGVARGAAVIVWYRPPGRRSIVEVQDGVYYCTHRREDVEWVLDRVGWRISEEVRFLNALPRGNLGWVLVRS